MPVPPEYQRASDEFYAFLIDARDNAGLATSHQAYTMVQGVLQAFRRRIDVCEAIKFAQTLPPLLRAVFVADWNTGEPKRAFEDVATMTKDAQSLRIEHNFAPETAIRDVAHALRRHVDVARFDQVLAGLPAGAAQFWSVSVESATRRPTPGATDNTDHQQ